MLKFKEFEQLFILWSNLFMPGAGLIAIVEALILIQATLEGVKDHYLTQFGLFSYYLPIIIYGVVLAAILWLFKKSLLERDI